MRTYHVDGCRINYVSREEWGGGPVRRGLVYPLDKFEGVVTHHTVSVAPDYDRDGVTTGDVDDMSQFMRYLQMARPDLGPEVPYSFVEFEDPNPRVAWLFEGRGLGRSGAHTQQGRNHDRYGVAIEGNTSVDAPSTALIPGLKLVRSWTTATAPTTGHRDWHATHCPGDGIYPRLHEVDEPIREGGSLMFMFKLPDGQWRVVIPEMGYADVSSPGHWRDVVGVPAYESPYMAALLDPNKLVDPSDVIVQAIGEIGEWTLGDPFDVDLNNADIARIADAVQVDYDQIARKVADELYKRLKG